MAYSNKMSIPWHEQNLKNMKSYYEREQKEILQKLTQLSLIDQSIKFLDRQIEEAKNRGLDGFDNGRFLKPKG